MEAEAAAVEVRVAVLLEDAAVGFRKAARGSRFGSLARVSKCRERKDCSGSTCVVRVLLVVVYIVSFPHIHVLETTVDKLQLTVFPCR